MYKSQAKNLEIEMNQMISQLKELQDNLEKECLASKESENLVKVYESKFFDLENERKEYQSQVKDLQKKYDNEVVAHQKSENQAETLRYQTKELETEMDQCQSQLKASFFKKIACIRSQAPSPSVKIQIMGGKVCFRCKGKTLLGIVNKLFISKVC